MQQGNHDAQEQVRMNLPFVGRMSSKHCPIRELESMAPPSLSGPFFSPFPSSFITPCSIFDIQSFITPCSKFDIHSSR